jgi:hypothetical protein
MVIIDGEDRDLERKVEALEARVEKLEGMCLI